MTFKQRLPYYFIGLVLGIIIVIFVFDKKNTSFDYGPNARVLKNMRIKNRVFSDDALKTIQNFNLDTSVISTVLNKGDVDMWNKIKTDSCTQYNISLDTILITVKNCETNAIIEKISVN